MELFNSLIINFFLALLLAQAQALADPGFTSHVNFELDSLKATFINYEQPRDKPYLIAHFKIFNPTKAQLRCDWRQLCTLVSEKGSTMNSNYDALVDLGNGMTRTGGAFPIAGGQKATVSLLFILGPGDLPAKLMLANGQTSKQIFSKGKVSR